MESEFYRFSEKIAAFVSPKNDYTEDLYSEILEKRKSVECKGLTTWSNIINVIKNHSKSPNTDRDIATFISLIQDLVGFECSREYLERSCMFVMKVTHLQKKFQDFSNADIEQIMAHFNSTSMPLIEQTLHCSLNLLSSIPKEKANFKFYYETQGKEFGSSIRLETFKHKKLDSSLMWLKPPQKKENGFSMNFNPKSLQKEAYEGPTKMSDKSSLTKIHKEPDFLDKHLRNLKNLQPSIVRQSLSGILNSAKNDDDLQEQLIGFLGFDNIELITEIMSCKKVFLQELQKSNINGKKINAPTPSYGMQVNVQNDNQKKLQKALMKEEKKMKKKNDAPQEEQQLNFKDFKIKREALLQMSKKQPLFSKGNSRSCSSAPEYPYVFDTQLKAKNSASYVAKVKMALPADIIRKEDAVMEQVDVPPSSKPPMDMLNKHVSITELDEIGQIAFQNTKKLNLIQSIVYPVAYTTNENLLICAPTGAGKTNIAMLTVISEIKNHLANGIIEKSEFKIIYIAPMKALAAEMVENFGQRLKPLDITVKEYTGDMQLSKTEILNTQMIVTTPEKWDVVTRKPSDESLTKLVRLLIIDEVHLLHDERGSVIESIVARTLRQVESTQTMIRIVGLSATLPNYLDVAKFLRVNPYTGLFFFDSRFRPVPLTQTFVGIKETNFRFQAQAMNNITYEKVIEQVKQGYQVMVFVHSRNDTVKTAELLLEMAKSKGQVQLFFPLNTVQTLSSLKQAERSANKKLRDMIPSGFATHHAGMSRQDRNLVERLFSEGTIKLIVCTATLAWGVNLPAHAVIIKGTQIYDAKQGSFVDLSILDVTQIFGRAGRPQFDTFGHGTIITAQDKLPHYLTLLVSSTPIESQFVHGLEDHLNAEIALGTVTNVEEGIRWLSYTYLYVRMRLNPQVYGVSYDQLVNDPLLEKRRRELIVSSCRSLDKARMVRFDEKSEALHSTSLGRTASHFYIKYSTIEIFNDFFTQFLSREDIFTLISKAEEFQQVKVREEEHDELIEHLHDCSVEVTSGIENTHGKVNVLLQSYISRYPIQSFSLNSDQAYIVQNASRISRSLFEIAMNNGWPLMADRVLTVSKFIEKRLWWWQSPMRQFGILSPEILNKIESKGLSIDKLREMDIKEIGQMIHHMKMGAVVKDLAHQIPSVNVEWNLQPVTRTVLKVTLTVRPTFKWHDKVHGKVGESFWIWIEDPINNHIYHHEYVLVHKKNVTTDTPMIISFTIPIFEPLPSQYYIRVVSDTWLGFDDTVPITFQHLILPERHPPHTELLDLRPLPKHALGDVMLEELYKFSHFNPIQTQVFHTLYHQDGNVLIGAPTGSGKTIMAELSIFRVFREYPKAKAVYIAPLKALVRERMEDWKIRIEQKLGKKVVELTGDVLPDMKAVSQADLIVTTPEKWDGISRSWQNRSYVKAVALLVIDEIHLLGDDRGPVLEVIVSRTNFISSHTDRKVRVVGLSTALANARDLADWLGIKQAGLYNFRPSVRPVPLEVHIAGFPGKHYCPRMATMNKPTFQAIQVHSPCKPVLVFVSSRRQTRLTALDLIAFLAAVDNPKQWLHLPENEMEDIISTIKDSNLKLTLAFGIGMHHAGLHEHDRKAVEELFVNQKIQVLIATSTLAWGVNFPAHLVVIKGTEYFDGKLKKYVDFPITDVLQMMGRAGRPQFDDQGKAVVLVHDVKKAFYKKFLYEPFPVESSLLGVLSDHLNAEIVAGTICTKQDAVDYLTWTYFFRRLINNPSYYQLEDVSHEVINKYLSSLVQKSFVDLMLSNCIREEEDNFNISPTTGGKISSYYYLSHLTIRHFKDSLKPESSVVDLLKILSNAHEFSMLPVRHNEDQLNEELSRKLPIKVEAFTYDKSSTKTHLLFQAHFSRCPLPIADYFTDTKSVMDQALRVLQSLIDLSAEEGWLVTTLQVIQLVQMVVQGLWVHQNPLLCLPHVTENLLHCFRNGGEEINSLPELMNLTGGRTQLLENMLRGSLNSQQINQIVDTLNMLPVIRTAMSLSYDSSSDYAEEGGSDSKPNVVKLIHQDMSRRVSWTKVFAGRECTLSVELSRSSNIKKKDNYVYPTKFPKPKEEGWVLVLGEVETKNVLALKKIGVIRNKTRAQLLFTAPERPGRVIYTLYVMSDSYLSLDQQYEIFLEVDK